MSRINRLPWLPIAAALVASVIASQPVLAGTMTFTSPTRDVALLEALPNANFGAFDANQSGRSANGITRSLMSFNVAPLAGQFHIIDSITLRLFFEGFDDNAVKTPGVYAITNANATWVPGTGNNTVQLGSSTWNNRIHNTTPWAGSAGLSTTGASLTTAGADYVNTLLSSITFSNLGTSPPAVNTPFDFAFTAPPNELTALVNNWLSVANAGLMLKDVNEGSLTGAINRIRFQSMEDSPGVHPMLIVTYSFVPEPSSLTLLGCGIVGLALKTRRRRRAA